MAKLKAPLLSFGASGKLADTLVYFPWKGLAVVRSYVIPANPNSAGQQTQRGILTESVASWHALGLDDDDVTAWNRYAASRPTPQSGFNAFVKDFVDLRVSGVILADTDMCYNGGLVDDGDGTFSAAVSTPAGPDHVDMIWGSSPPPLINTVTDAVGPSPWTFAPANNVAGRTIYARFRGRRGLTSPPPCPCPRHGEAHRPARPAHHPPLSRPR